MLSATDAQVPTDFSQTKFVLILLCVFICENRCICGQTCYKFRCGYCLP